MLSLLSLHTSVAPAPISEETRDNDDQTYSSHNSDSTEEIDIIGDQFESMSDVRLRLSSWDLCALGLTTAIGGHFYIWSISLVAGFGSLLIATFLIASAYGCLILCMAELSSALPFAGMETLLVLCFRFVSL